MAKKNDKNNDILISIIVPVYNTSKYLVKCLDSVYAAIDNDCEVIIVNDGSTDDSEKIIKDYVSNLKNEVYKNNTVYIYKENKGLADTKNVGIKRSRGKFISVVDSDDRINKNFYRDAREYLDKNDMVIYDLYTDYEDDPKYNHIIRAAREDCLDSKVSKFVHGAMQGSSCNKIIKKNLYKYEFPVGKQYEDVAVTPFLLMEAKNIKYIPNPYYIYLQRKTSIVGTNKLDEAYFKICENINDVFENNKLKYKNYKELVCEFYFLRIIDVFDHSLRKNKGKIKSLVESYIENNRYMLNEIHESIKSVEELPDMLTKNQRIFEFQLFNLLYQGNVKKSIGLFKKRRFLNYFRRVYGCLKKLIKAIFGGAYSE